MTTALSSYRPCDAVKQKKDSTDGIAKRNSVEATVPESSRVFHRRKKRLMILSSHALITRHPAQPTDFTFPCCPRCRHSRGCTYNLVSRMTSTSTVVTAMKRSSSRN
jgi:hypothetical protein